MTGDRLQFDEGWHAAGEQVELPHGVARMLAWWVAAELIRRHPATLRVIETHPGGGQYDCVSLFRRTPDGSDTLFAHLNIVGHITHADWFQAHSETSEERFNWFEVLMAGQERRAYVIEPLERATGIASPIGTPVTTERSIGPRLLSRFATWSALSHRDWPIRNGFYDSEGSGSGVHEWVRNIAGVSLDPLPNDLFEQAAYRLWYVLDHRGRPLTAIDVELGKAWRYDGEGATFDLLSLYSKHDHKLDTLAHQVFPDVE